MRLFFAIGIPDKIKEEVYSLVPKYRYIKFVKKENLHITLKFMGNAGNPFELIRRASSVRFNPFRMSLEGMGAFPNKKNPRVLWIGVNEGSSEVIGLARSIDAITRDIRLNDNEFVPHLTIARLNDLPSGKIFHEHFKSSLFEVCEFLLMESALSLSGPTYRVIKRFKSNER